MSETQMRSEAAGYPRPGRSGPASAGTQTGWLGWIVFAGTMMIMLGFFQAIEGLVALFDDGYYLVANDGLVVSADFTVWGWVHLLTGLVALGAGIGVIMGQTWARVIGVIVAMFSAVANLAFLAAYPIWSVLAITLDIIVIYALTVHGREAKAAYDE